MVYVANLGDSRAVLCRMEGGGGGEERQSVTLSLSKEHNPTIYEERMRIQRAGGIVREGRVLGVLEVSRSIRRRSVQTLWSDFNPDPEEMSADR
uniref:integrin-linked kinase-associated serine/threonine phosphatase 2C-like n=1 Tax=Centroberyx gerrardi TaxID=166262 RepID=UPI003AAE1838